MSEKMYTDEELCWASQVAYCNINQADINQYYWDNNGEYPTLQYIFNQYGYSLFFDQKIMNDENEGDMLVMELEAKEFIDGVKAGTICSDWRVIAVSDELNQEREGFYAVTIQTGEEDAIVAFRGSEKTDVNQFIEDWVVADFTMLGAELTEQEVLASDYLYKTIQDTDYDNFAVTGHSLGGNLAIVSTIRAKYTDNQDGTDIASRIK